MWLRTAAAAIGLAAIVSCGALIDGVKQFPGPWALVPVGAAVLLILAPPTGSRIRRPATGCRCPTGCSPPPLLVALGAMAYSLYLWHWPLLIFWLAYSGDARAGFLPGTVILLVSGVLAYLTTRFVEEPLRYRRGAAAPAPVAQCRGVPACAAPPWRWAHAGAARRGAHRDVVHLARARDRAAGQRQRNSLGLSSAEYPGARALLNHARVPNLPMRPTVLEAKDDVPKSTSDGCISDFDNAGVINCTYGDPSATRTIALAGGSPRRALDHRAGRAGPEAPFQGRDHLKMGCPLTTERIRW